MITAQEIIKNRKRQQKQKQIQLQLMKDAKNANRGAIRNEIISVWNRIGNELVDELKNSTDNYRVYHGNGGNPDITVNDYEKFADYSLKQSIAESFINAGYEVALSFPWDDWGGAHHGEMIIGLPRSLNPAYTIKLNKKI